MVSSLVLRLAQDESGDRACEALSRDPRILLGGRKGTFLPVVTEVGSLREGQTLAEEISALHGVLGVDLVQAYWESTDA
ncbi:MAG: hypothetical protein RJA70_61 [Pseudomonadota bacterium]|jgi:hypothetical protein